LLLTRAVPVPRPGEIPRHERFYYLELLRRAGILDSLPQDGLIHLDGAAAARASGAERFRTLGWGEAVIGLSPGAAYGTAKRWIPGRFADAANRLARELGASVAIFGSNEERELCETVKAALAAPSRNF